MDGFADDFVPVEKPETDADPAAEFLAREQNDLAGLEDDIPTQDAEESLDNKPATVTNGASADIFSAFEDPPPQYGEFTLDPLSENDIPQASGGLFGLAQDEAFSPIKEEKTEPEAMPLSDLDLGGSSAVLGEGTLAPLQEQVLGGDSAETVEPKVVSAPSPVPPVVKEEPEKIRIWREEQENRLKEKDAAEASARDELREKAKKELEDWYKQHEEQVAKTRQANRSAEKELVADTSRMEPGTEWERIAKLCDFNPKTAKSSRDISRMRSIILQVKQNPPAKA